jgi:AcrR family transcriptional regulator
MIDSENAVVSQIVEAARSHFLRFGYSRVSTEDIARSIGRSKKTLYKHFTTKEVLLRAVFARVDGEAQREIAVLVAEGGGDRLARLRGILTAVAVHLASVHQVLLADLLVSSPEFGRQAWRERRQAFAAMLQPVLREAAEEGVIRPDLPVDTVLTLFCSCVEGMLSPMARAQNAQVEDGRFCTLVSLMVDGIRAR